MRKCLFALMLTCFLFSSCQTNDPSVSNEEKVLVIFTPETELETQVDQMNAPRRTSSTSSAASQAAANSAASISKMKDFWIIEDETVLAHVHNTDSTSTFCNNISIPLSVGTHTMSFLMTRSEGPQMSNGTFTADKILDTYGVKKDIIINTSKDSTIKITLNRIVYKLNISLKDKVNSNIKKLRVYTSNYNSAFETTTFEGDGKLNNYYRDWDISAYNGRVIPVDFPIYGFTDNTTNKNYTNIIVQYLNENDSVLNQKSVNNVSIQANCLTTISGYVLDGNSTPTITVTSDYSNTSFAASLNE